MARSQPWNPAADIINPSNFLLYEVAADGDAYISVNSPFQVNQPVLIRVSTRALSRTSRFFKAQFSDRWSHNRFTVSNPLVLPERFTHFVTFLHFCHEDDVVSEGAASDLKDVGLLCDKYLFEGQLSAQCFNALNTFLPRGLRSHIDTDEELINHVLGGRPRPSELLQILEVAYLTNVPKIFAKASRAMMWSMSYEDIRKLLPQDLVARLPIDFVASFKEEALRLRKDLVSKLPAVFYPDPHGSNPVGCGKCASVTPADRWYREVIFHNDAWQHEQRLEQPFMGLGTLFESYVEAMNTRSHLQQNYGNIQHSLRCGRYRPRRLDVTPLEIVWHVYQAIGGVCLLCVKAGEFKYGTSCAKHNVDLRFN